MRPDGSAGPFYSDSGKKTTYIASKGSRIYGDKGVTSTISAGKSFTIGGAVTGTVQSEASAIIAKASVSLAIQVTVSRTTTTTSSGSWKVPTSEGWLETGTVNASTFHWTKWHFVQPCRRVTIASGTGSAPLRTSALKFHHS